MKHIRKICAAALVLSVIMTAGCGAGESSVSVQNTTVSQTTTSEIATTSSATPETTAAEQPEATEKINMMDYKSSITELIPEGYEEVRDGVTYSEFQKLTYYSKTAERDTPVNVLLPPDYSEDKEYPVLYILHGFYDSQEWMARPVVNLSTIYGNLLADGEAEEMIIVLPYIFCDKEMQWCTGMDLKNSLAYDNFINDLTTDLMPFIESEFSVAAGRENTAITGFSMGGRESLFIGCMHPEMFGYIGSVCAAPGLVEVEGSAMHPGQLTKEQVSFGENKPYVVLISYSKADGVVGTFPNNYRRLLTDNGEEYLTHTMQSTGHDHTSVKPHLYNFMKMLFK